MRIEKTTWTKTQWALAGIVALSTIGIAAPLAFADTVGAPTSAAGGTSPTPLIPPVTSRPAAAGPLGSTTGASTVRGSTSSGIQSRTPGTGKFDDPKSPCIGSTGFGSSNAQPGRRC